MEQNLIQPSPAANVLRQRQDRQLSDKAEPSNNLAPDPSSNNITPGAGQTGSARKKKEMKAQQVSGGK